MQEPNHNDLSIGFYTTKIMQFVQNKIIKEQNQLANEIYLAGNCFSWMVFGDRSLVPLFFPYHPFPQ